MSRAPRRRRRLDVPWRRVAAATRRVVFFSDADRGRVERAAERSSYFGRRNIHVAAAAPRRPASAEDLHGIPRPPRRYGGPEDVDDAALAAPPDGKWHGYFFNPVEDKDDQKVKEKGIKVTFSSGGVSGGGSNEFGEFTLKGKYDAAAKTLECRKAYLYADDDEDDDVIEDAAAEDVKEEIAGLEGDADIPIEELRARMAAFEEEERQAKKARVE